MKSDIKEEIEIPQGVEVRIDKGFVKVNGPKGEVTKTLLNPKIGLVVEGNKVFVSAKKATKREETLIGTFKAHIKRMIKGVVEVFVYKLKICSSHFPMNASISNNEFVVKNFLGETVPRTFKITKGANVKVEGEFVTVESPDKEIAGQTAASIEQLCRITDKDKRIFQDGIYIISKTGREMK